MTWRLARPGRSYRGAGQTLPPSLGWHVRHMAGRLGVWTPQIGADGADCPESGYRQDSVNVAQSCSVGPRGRGGGARRCCRSVTPAMSARHS